MPNQRFPLIVTLRSKDGQMMCKAMMKWTPKDSYTDDGPVILRGTIKSPTDSCIFYSVPPRRYIVYGLFADGSKILDRSLPFSSTVSSRTCYLNPECSEIRVSPPDPADPSPTDTPPRLPVKVIAGFAIPAALMSHFGGAAPLIKEISNTLLKPKVTSISTQASYGNTFSGRVRTQMKTCIKNNAIELYQIPTFSKLLKSVSWEREIEGEFEQQIIALYGDYEQLRIAINRCDPRLAQEIAAARTQVAEADGNKTVFVIGELVNLRVAPNGQVTQVLPYGTPVLLDQSTTARLSEDQKRAIEQGAGWQPIILSSGETGYIYSLYISDSL